MRLVNIKSVQNKYIQNNWAFILQVQANLLEKSVTLKKRKKKQLTNSKYFEAMSSKQVKNAALVGEQLPLTQFFIEVKNNFLEEETEEEFTTVTHNYNSLIHYESRNKAGSTKNDMHTTHALSVISTSTESCTYGGYDELKFYQNLNKKFRQNALNNWLSCIYMVVMFSAEVAVSINRMVNSVKNSIGLDSCKSILVVVIESIELNEKAFSDAEQRLFKCIDQNQVVCIFISAKNHNQWVKECMLAMTHIIEYPGEKGIFTRIETEKGPRYNLQRVPIHFPLANSNQKTNNFQILNEEVENHSHYFSNQDIDLNFSREDFIKQISPIILVIKKKSESENPEQRIQYLISSSNGLEFSLKKQVHSSYSVNNNKQTQTLCQKNQSINFFQQKNITNQCIHIYQKIGSVFNSIKKAIEVKLEEKNKQFEIGKTLEIHHCEQIIKTEVTKENNLKNFDENEWDSEWIPAIRHIMQTKSHNEYGIFPFNENNILCDQNFDYIENEKGINTFNVAVVRENKYLGQFFMGNDEAQESLTNQIQNSQTHTKFQAIVEGGSQSCDENIFCLKINSSNYQGFGGNDELKLNPIFNLEEKDDCLSCICILVMFSHEMVVNISNILDRLKISTEFNACQRRLVVARNTNILTPIVQFEINQILKRFIDEKKIQCILLPANNQPKNQTETLI